MKKYVAIRAKYYKKAAGKKVIAHCLRTGAHARNQNVTKPENQKDNIYSFDKNKFAEVEARHKKAIGKNPQKNRNAIFETAIIFSEENFSKVGAKNHEEYLEKYMENIKEEYGFELLGFTLHLDEGHENINTHAHAFFYNFDFKNKKAPLRDLMKKGNDKNGQVNKLNPQFVKIQDIAASTFAPLNYIRGESKDVTSAEHKEKEKFVKDKLKEVQKSIKNNKLIIGEQLNTQIKNENEITKQEKEKLKLKDEIIKLKDELKAQIKLWVFNGLKYIKKSLKNGEAKDEAEKTIEEEPDIHKDIKKVFYEEVSGIAKNDEIKNNYQEIKQEQKKKRKNKIKI